jgi:class 3 adenylate cyclase
MVVCYIKAIGTAALPMIGSWEMNPHVQAVLMWMLASITVVAIHRDQARHGDRRPLYIAVGGLLVLIGTLYVYWNVLVLFLGYMLLLFAAFANQHAILRRLNQQVRSQADELAEWNRTLKTKVDDQVAELDRVGQLKRFLSPEIVDLVTAEDETALLESHRRYIAALFCDLRGFTAFSERAEPEEVMDVLQLYHKRLGTLISEHHGTIDHRAGDGLMVFFNDPLPCEEPVFRAIKLAFAMRASVAELTKNWAKLGHELGFGIGIAAGYATLGVVGDECRIDYTAVGNVINLASRLCDEAKDGEILVNHRAYIEVESRVEAQQVTGIRLKGVSRLQEVHCIKGLLAGPGVRSIRQ